MSRSGSTSPWRHLPNLITLLRLLLVLPLSWAIVEGHHPLALALVALAGLSDAADGLLARRYGWSTRLGGILDPIADKLMLAACYVSLAVAAAVPWWLTWLVLGRDAVIGIGALAYDRLVGRLQPQPTALSKLNTLVQIVFVLAVLLQLAGGWRIPVAALIWMAAASTLASGLDYVLRWAWRAYRGLKHKRDTP